MPKEKRKRAYCFTINNWTEEDLNGVKDISCNYIIAGDEVGDNGTRHIQGYVEFENAKTFSRVKKLLPRAHIEPRRGTPLEASDYCKMDGKVLYESGELSQQGQRSDLAEVAVQIANGTLNENQLLAVDPYMYHQYGRTINKLQDLALRQRYRTEATQGIWYTGPTGAGKSHTAFEGYHPDTHYVVPNDGGWWDGYTGQETIIINEFRGEIKYKELLEILDKWPKTVRRRGREPAPLLAKTCIITSKLRPEEVYHNLSENDTMDQFYRRCKIITLEKRT